MKTVNVDFKTRSSPIIWYPTMKEGNKEFMTLLNDNKINMDLYYMFQQYMSQIVCHLLLISQDKSRSDIYLCS